MHKWKKLPVNPRRSAVHEYREIIFSVLGKNCRRCGDLNNPHIHHIVPVRRGGTHEMKNVTILCHVCHKKEHKKVRKIEEIIQ